VVANVELQLVQKIRVAKRARKEKRAARSQAERARGQMDNQYPYEESGDELGEEIYEAEVSEPIAKTDDIPDPTKSGNHIAGSNTIQELIDYLLDDAQDAELPVPAENHSSQDEDNRA
jgi:hypothetical protein